MKKEVIFWGIIIFTSIEKAIEGKWQPCDIITEVKNTSYTENGTNRVKGSETVVTHKHTFMGVWLYGKDGDGCHYGIHQILLDPKAWEAVGRAEEWGIHYHGEMPDYASLDEYKLQRVWREKQLQFIQNLQEGLTIEEALNKVMNT